MKILIFTRNAWNLPRRYWVLIQSINERRDVVILTLGFVVGRPRCRERACISSSRATLNTARAFYSGRVHSHLGYWLHPSYRHTDDDEAGCLICFGCSLLSMQPRISSRQVDTQSAICACARKKEHVAKLPFLGRERSAFKWYKMYK